MADFNVGLNEPRGEGAGYVAAPTQRIGVAPVQNNTLGVLVEGATSLFKAYQQGQANKKEQEKASIIAGFAEEQTALNDAMYQGSMSKHEAAARARANVSKYVGMFPAFSKDFAGINKDLFEHSELGEAKDETQLWKDQRKSILADMQKAGVVITPSMSPQTQEGLMSAFQEGRRLDAEVDKRIKRNAESRAQSNEERAAIQFEDREVASKGLVSLGSAWLAPSQTFIADLTKRREAGGDPAVLKLELGTYFTNLEGAVNAIAAKNPELGNSWKQMFSEVRKMGEEGIDGKFKADALENQLKTIKNKAQLMALSDPTMQGLYATSALLHGQIPATFYDTNQAARDTLARIAGGQKGTAPLLGNASAEKASNDLVVKNVQELKTGTHKQPEQAKEQLGRITTKLMQEMDNLSSDPSANYKTLSNVSNLLASPEWAYMVENNIVSKEHNEKAKQAFQMIYTKDVSKGVVDKLKSQFTFTNAPAKPLTDIVDIKWSGSGVSFDKKPQYLTAFERQDQAQYVRELNSSSVALNKLIHIGAHMEGHTNYEKYWENNKHLMLPGLYVPKGTLDEGYEYVGPGFATEKSSWKKITKE